jgi:hypothetical protein
MNFMTITITNKKVIEFYESNPNISIDHVNLLLVDMMEKMVHDSINSSMVSQLLDRLKTVETDIKTTRDSVSKIQPDIILSLTVKLMEMKKEYMEDIRSILTSNVSEKIAPVMKEYTNHLIDKTALLFQDIPKSQDALSVKLQESIRDIQKSILEESKKVSSGQTLQEFMFSIEQKFNSTQLILNSSYEKMDYGLKEIKLTQEHQHNAMKELSSINQQSVQDLLRKMDNSSSKGKVSENLLFHMLQTMYPSAGLEFVGTTKETGDFILERTNKPKLLIENKNWESNVSKDEVEKFVRDTSIQNCCGVFLSQHTGIANKENYEINVQNGNILIYVHNVNNDFEKIKIAIDIIDHFKEQLDSLEQDVEVDTIPKEVLQNINDEYKVFVSKKGELQKYVKDFTTKMCKQIDDINSPSLSLYLSSRYTSVSNYILCECGKECKNKQAYSAHKRGCALSKSDN